MFGLGNVGEGGGEGVRIPRTRIIYTLYTHIHLIYGTLYTHNPYNILRLDASPSLTSWIAWLLKARSCCACLETWGFLYVGMIRGYIGVMEQKKESTIQGF